MKNAEDRPIDGDTSDCRPAEDRKMSGRLTYDDDQLQPTKENLALRCFPSTVCTTRTITRTSTVR